MKEHIEVIKDSFVDYAGKTHHFMIAAISTVLPSKGAHLENNSISVDDDANIFYEVVGQIEECDLEEYLGNVVKVVRIGVSICNPEDTFNEKAGAFKATARARNAEPALYSSNVGFINARVIKALLEQEAEYLKNNPENFIKGYAEMKRNFLKKQEMIKMASEFSDVEKTIVEELQKNSKFLNNAFSYLEWLENQKKGNAGKIK